MAEQAAAAEQQQQQEPVQISLQDIATLVQMVDVVSRRGAFEGTEMAGIGILRNKLEMFLRQNAPKGEQPPEGAMPAATGTDMSVPPEAPLADKVQ